jgi:hypothetical protein
MDREVVERHLHAARRQLEALEARGRAIEEQRLCTAGAVQALEKLLAEPGQAPAASAGVTPAGQEHGNP